MEVSPKRWTRNFRKWLVTVGGDMTRGHLNRICITSWKSQSNVWVGQNRSSNKNLCKNTNLIYWKKRREHSTTSGAQFPFYLNDWRLLKLASKHVGSSASCLFFWCICVNRARWFRYEGVCKKEIVGLVMELTFRIQHANLICAINAWNQQVFFTRI